MGLKGNMYETKMLPEMFIRCIYGERIVDGGKLYGWDGIDLGRGV